MHTMRSVPSALEAVARQRFDIIEPLVGEESGRRLAGKEVAARAAAAGISKASVYRWLRVYQDGGRDISALVPQRILRRNALLVPRGRDAARSLTEDAPAVTAAGDEPSAAPSPSQAANDLDYIRPGELVVSRAAVLGLPGYGKTYAATKLAELLIAAGHPIVAIDPSGVWQSLRRPAAGPSGKGFPVLVAGGAAADITLTARNAREIMALAIEKNVSVVFDLFDPSLSRDDWSDIVEAVCTALLFNNAASIPRHVFFEEASEFVPQQLRKGNMEAYNAVERLARIGGNMRVGMTFVNQRAEQLNKAVFELCDTLVLCAQAGRNSLRALDHWFKAVATDDVDAGAILASMPGLQKGECWMWSRLANAPFTRVNVPAKTSFHPDRRLGPSATPPVPVQLPAECIEAFASFAAVPPEPPEGLADDEDANVTDDEEHEESDLGERVRCLEAAMAELRSELASLRDSGRQPAPAPTSTDEAKARMQRARERFEVIAPLLIERSPKLIRERAAECGRQPAELKSWIRALERKGSLEALAVVI